MGSCKGKLLSSFQQTAFAFAIVQGTDFTLLFACIYIYYALAFGMKYSVFCLKLHPNKIMLQKISAIFFQLLTEKNKV